MVSYKKIREDVDVIMGKKLKILTLNFGSTSSRIAIYENGKCIENIYIQHEDKLLEMPLFPQQCDYENWLL